MKRNSLVLLCLMLCLSMLVGCQQTPAASPSPSASGDAPGLMDPVSPVPPAENAAKGHLFTYHEDGFLRRYTEAGAEAGSLEVGARMISYATLDQKNGVIYYVRGNTATSPSALCMVGAALDGAEPTVLAENVTTPIHLSDGKLYFRLINDGFYSYDTANGTKTRVLALEENFVDFIVDGNNLYYTVFFAEDEADVGLYRHSLADGTGAKIDDSALRDDESGSPHIVGFLGDSLIYKYVYGGYSKLLSVGPTGADVRALSTEGTFHLVDGDSILYAEPSDNYHIHRIDANGENRVMVAEVEALTLQLLNGWIYYTPESDYVDYSRYNPETDTTETLPDSFVGRLILAQ